ncbi:hypothetical protein PsorP6_015662 [Peronosclerospora sorghi]|uniref:Uncharacterized protein n=1 Tax=Peronosclerospora sorghi TaxID=230839 RepID=A0ACC0WN97_9STRA|nr:hypothetical protein PsorP6_015662 [Peronosclerospora sorghi]
MEDKSTYIDAQASIDQISTSLYRQQYLSALSFISFLTIKRRQDRYLKLRPKKIRVKDDPRAWQTYAINAVLLYVRERLAHVYKKRDGDEIGTKICALLQHSHTFSASLVSPDVRLLSEEVARFELDDSEFEMDVKDLIKLRLTLRKEITEREKEKEALNKLQSLHARSAQDAEMSTRSRLWSYATWLTGGGPNSTDSSGHNTEGVRIEDVKWSDQDTIDLYEAIDFHPEKSDISESEESEDVAARVTHVHKRTSIFCIASNSSSCKL